MSDLITPRINLNGNTASSLIEQLALVLHNAHHLEQSMRHAYDCWHGRNFQTCNDHGETQRKAEAAWYERAHWVSEFIIEIQQLMMEIDAQQQDREAHRARPTTE